MSLFETVKEYFCNNSRAMEIRLKDRVIAKLGTMIFGGEVLQIAGLPNDLEYTVVLPNGDIIRTKEVVLRN